VFYGPEILKGLALATLREIRRMGLEFWELMMEHKADPGFMAKLLPRLFRPEAKMPHIFKYDKADYVYQNEPSISNTGSIEEINLKDEEEEEEEEYLPGSPKKTNWFLETKGNATPTVPIRRSFQTGGEDSEDYEESEDEEEKENLSGSPKKTNWFLETKGSGEEDSESSEEIEDKEEKVEPMTIKDWLTLWESNAL